MIIFRVALIFLLGLAALDALTLEERVESKQYVAKHLSGWEGWCALPKAHAMMDLVFDHSASICVEIGVFGGSSLFPVAYALKTQGFGMVYAIDPWDNRECVENVDKEDPNYQWWSQVDLNLISKKLLMLRKGYKLENYTTIIRKTSEAAVSLIPDNIDILHIDGNFSEESTLKDVLLYFSKVKKGGYIWLSNPYWVDLHSHFTKQKAINFLNKRCKVILEVENTLLFEKD